MKKIIGLVLLSLTACAQLMHGQEQPVVEKDSKNGVYFTTCSGAVEDSSNCITKAYRTCSKGFEIIKRYETPVGGRRELTFQCKK